MNVKTLTEQILIKKSKIARWQYRFMKHLFPLWLAVRGRYNFANLSRWGGMGEDTYRQNFGKPFDWLGFNVELASSYLGKEQVIAFDPCFLPKSGKHTAGVGYFYSGCAGRELRGLEFSGIAAIDIADKAALHLEAVQTIDVEPKDSLLIFYASILSKRRLALQRLSKYIVADAYFAKRPFVETILNDGYQLITRLRKDARLRYLYHGPRRKGRGRPKSYDGKIDPKSLREDHFTPCAQAQDGSWKAYEAIANVQSWKTNARIVIVHYFNEQQAIKSVRIYACTDLSLDGAQIFHAYQCRFQIEFLFRDGKQHAGLAHCQARSPQKLSFHLNASLTAVSLAKVAHHLNTPVGKRKAFSMANVKTQYANDLLLDRFIATFGISAQLAKINSIRERIRAIGKIAA